MRKIGFIFLTIIMLAQWSCITNQNKYKETDIFEEYETHGGFTVLHLPPVLFKIALSVSDESGTSSKDILNKIDVVKVLFFEESERSLSVLELKNSFNEKIIEYNYNLLTRIAEEKNDISIYIIEEEKTIYEVLITIVSEGEYLALNIVGQLTKEDVMEVYKSVNMQNIQNL